MGSPIINRIGEYWKKLFGEKVYKISVDGGFTCPNRDGTKGRGGCIYCDGIGFRPDYVKPSLSIREQVESGIKTIKSKLGIHKFIVYFQIYTNTYAPVSELRKKYFEALSHPDVVGISISTRPDCVGEDVLDLIEEIAKDYHTWLEIGIESIYERHLLWMNRGHTIEDTEDAISRIKKRENINLLGHLIFGLEGEDVIEIAKKVSEWGLDGVKMHHLYVVRNTPLERLYRRGEVKVFENPEDYAELAVKFIEHIPKSVLIHRLAGYVNRDILVAPEWTARRNFVEGMIEKLLHKRNSYQGKYSGD